jgi:hypothetical protein
LTWERALDIKNDSGIVIDTNFSHLNHTLVAQGGLGDCYFVNAILALALKSQEAVQDMFVS